MNNTETIELCARAPFSPETLLAKAVSGLCAASGKGLLTARSEMSVRNTQLATQAGFAN